MSRLFDYECQKCLKVKEWFENEVPQLCECGGVLQRLFPIPAILFDTAVRKKSRGPNYDPFIKREISVSEEKDICHPTEPKWKRDQKDAIKALDI